MQLGIGGLFIVVGLFGEVFLYLFFGGYWNSMNFTKTFFCK